MVCGSSSLVVFRRCLRVTAAATATMPIMRHFAEALLRGLRAAVDKPHKAVRILHAAYPDVRVEGAAAQLVLMCLCVDPRTPGGGMGRFDFSRVGRGVVLVRACGVYRAPVAREQVVDLGVVVR